MISGVIFFVLIQIYMQLYLNSKKYIGTNSKDFRCHVKVLKNKKRKTKTKIKIKTNEGMNEKTLSK